MPRIEPTSRKICVTFQQEGIHRYPQAATDPTLATGDWDDVSWLANDHRHIFHFTVKITVGHSDRDLEFIQEKRFMERLYGRGTLQLDHKSCEMMAEDLYEKLAERYAGSGRLIEISVFEDGENGAILEFPPV